MARDSRDRRRGRYGEGRLRREETLWAYVFLAPWIIGLVVVHLRADAVLAAC